MSLDELYNPDDEQYNPDMVLTENVLLAMSLSEQTLFKSCRCHSDLHERVATFNVIVWDVTTLDNDEQCPECLEYTDDFDLFAI